MTPTPKNKTDIFIAFFVGLLISFLPVILHRNAYYHDDMQAQFMPMYYAIGNNIIHFHSLPILTTHSWLGGNIIGEFQYGIFNPIEDFLYLFLPFCHSLSMGAAFLACVHYGILSAGSFFLARVIGVPRVYSFVAMLAISTNNFLFYWFASSWFPDFTSITFMVWAIAFIILSQESRLYFCAAIISTYLTVTAGFPQTVVVVCLFVLIYTMLYFFKNRKLSSLIPMAAFGSGSAAAVVSFLPTAAMLKVGNHGGGIYNTGFLVPGLGDLFFAANPVHASRIMAFGGYTEIRQSIFYAAWFIFPIIIFTNWKSIRTLPVRVFSIAIFSILLFMLTQGPEQLGPIRFSIRFIPYFHIFSIITLLYFWSHFPVKSLSYNRFKVLLGVVVFTTLLSLQQFPHMPRAIIWSGVILAAASYAFAYKKLNPVLWYSLTLGIAIFARLSGGPANPATAEWGAYVNNLHADNLSLIPKDYSICLISNPTFSTDSERFEDVWFGNMGLAHGIAGVNGYSPIGQQALVTNFFPIVHGWTLPNAGQTGLSRDAITGLTIFDLMRVSTVVAAAGSDAERFANDKSTEWQLIKQTKYASKFTHKLPNQSLPGSLSWPLSGYTVTEPQKATATKEILQFGSIGPDVHDLIFARTYWLGYKATFNGVSIPVTPYNGYFISVKLPDNAKSGTLELTFHIPFLKVSIFAAFLSMLTTGLLLVWRRIWRFSGEEPVYHIQK